jgi:hypothetical protein
MGTPDSRIRENDIPNGSFDAIQDKGLLQGVAGQPDGEAEGGKEIWILIN